MSTRTVTRHYCSIEAPWRVYSVRCWPFCPATVTRRSWTNSWVTCRRAVLSRRRTYRSGLSWRSRRSRLTSSPSVEQWSRSPGRAASSSGYCSAPVSPRPWAETSVCSKVRLWNKLGFCQVCRGGGCNVFLIFYAIYNISRKNYFGNTKFL